MDKDDVFLEQYLAEAADLMRWVLAAPKETATPLKRELAELLVTVRSKILRSDGTPDLSGHTPTYRRFVGRACEEAGIQGEEKRRLLAGVRYHVTTAVRRRFGLSTVQDYGLDPEDGREKSKERRATRAKLRVKDAYGGAELAIVGARDILSSVDPADVDALASSDSIDVVKVLMDIEQAAARLIGRLRGAA